jgi:hypothetical protein
MDTDIETALAPEPLEDELAVCIDALFWQYPLLQGFCVQGSNALPEELRLPALENALVVDVGVDPVLGSAYSNRVSDEISGVLLELLKLRPEAVGLLRDRVFARTTH